MIYKIRFVFIIIVLLFCNTYLLAQDNETNTEEISGEQNLGIGFGLSIMPIGFYCSTALLNTRPSVTSFGDFMTSQFTNFGGGYGVRVEYPLGNFLSLESGIEYSFTSTIAQNIYDVSISYLFETIYLPLHLKVRWYKKYWMPYIIAGVEVGYIINAAYDGDNDGTYTSILDSEGRKYIRLGLNIGLGMSFDFGIGIFDLLLNYSLGIINDINHNDFLKIIGNPDIYGTKKNIFSFVIGYRFLIGDRRAYMPPAQGVILTPVPEIKPIISIDTTYVEKKSLTENQKLTVTISNYESLYLYAKQFRLRIKDKYGNEVINEAFSVPNKELTFEITLYNNFRSFEDYSVEVEAFYSDLDYKTSNELTFSTGIILIIDEFSHKTIASSSLEFNEDGTLTPATKEKITEILEFIKTFSEEYTIDSLDIGIEQVGLFTGNDENDNLISHQTNQKVKYLENFLLEDNIGNYVKSYCVFSDFYINDNIPNLITFYLVLEEQKTNL